MLVLTSKYGSLIDLDLLKNKKKYPLINHRLTIDLNQCKDIEEAYLVFLDNKDKYIIGYKAYKSDILQFIKKLGKLDVFDAGWLDVSDLKSLSFMFWHCRFKKIIGLEKWDVSNCEDMNQIFGLCDDLKSISDISGWDVSNVKDMNQMFYECLYLHSIGDISYWNPVSVKDMSLMFYSCGQLKNVGNLNKWHIDHTTTNLDKMFRYSGITPWPEWAKKR